MDSGTPVHGLRELHNEEAELARRCIAGDADAWAALVARYQRLVYAIVVRMGLDEHTAADVFQTVFERLMKHLPRLADPSRLQAWIVTTTRREALRVRAAGRRTQSLTRADDDGSGGGDDLSVDIADEAAGAQEQIEELQQLHLLRLALERLDTRCRDLLQLLFRDADERVPYEDVAAQLSLPLGSIGPTRARCLAKLRRLVE
jgi:RNA polymerase sigma factor (sigma-70 family)